MKKDNKIKPNLYKENVNPNNAIIGEFITQVALNSEYRQKGTNVMIPTDEQVALEKEYVDENHK